MNPRRRPPLPRRVMVLAVAGLLAMIAPAAAAASVRILNDPLSAQAELVNAQTWAEAAGHITFPSSLQGDSVVALTAPPRRPCPARPPPGAPTNPGPGVDAESVPVLADRDQEEFLLTPTRQEVTGQTTRLCAYLLRGGVVQTRGSRRLTVALAKPPSPRRKHASGDGARLTASELLALLLVALAGIGMVTTARKLARRKRSSGSKQHGQPRPTEPAASRPTSVDGGNAATTAPPTGGRRTSARTRRATGPRRPAAGTAQPARG